MGDQRTNLLYDQALAILSVVFEQFLGLFQSPLIGTEFSLTHKNLMNLFMTTTTDFIFLKNILDFPQMLIPPK